MKYSRTVQLVHPTAAPWLVRTSEGCQLSLWIRGGDAVRAVYLRGDPDNEEHLLALPRASAHDGWARYDGVLPWDLGNITTHYAFKIVDGERQRWLAADGVHAHAPPREVLFKVCRDHAPPPWVAAQVVYQIFPDRFCQGDPSHAVQTDEYIYGDGRSRVVRKAWGEPVDRATAATAFYGGDLPGVRAQLDYLQRELGVTTLYLNPVFTSGSNHKYDTEDYDNVDRHLGGNAALAALCDDLHARGMRIVLDAVVNHTGANHHWFDRHARHDGSGAYRAADSPRRAWYMFSSETTYASWKGHDSLPVLDFANPEVCAAVYGAPDSILRRWLRPPYAIDGWRFDVIHMLGEGPGAHNNPHHVRQMRRAVRDENAEAYVLGEHFGEATRWLQGDQEDGAMNYYGFAMPLRAWLAGRDVAGHPAQLTTVEFERWLTAARARIPYDNQLAQLNLIDSHDTSRFLTAAEGDVAKLQIAAALLFSYPGVPCIYYGDEIGLEGGNDPDCRRCFDWDRARWHAPLHARYRQLSAWRHARAEWQRGAYQTLAVTDDALVFARYLEDAATIIAVHRGDAAVALDIALDTLPLPALQWRDEAGAAMFPTTITLAPRSAACWFGDR